MAREDWRQSLDDEQGGWRGTLRRIFGGSENPMRWGFPLYSAWGILVRVHLLFPIFIAARLIQTLVQDSAGLVFVAPLLIALFLLVLLHEYGHCLVCRRVGGEADEILLWPLGGLASCSPPHRWDAAFWTTAGGPLVNAALLMPLGLATWLATRDIGTVLFNPFDPWFAAGLIDAGSAIGKVAKITLWSFHYANLLLLAFNVLVPMYPMDGGRLVHALLWRTMGHREATRIAAIIGLVTAAVLAVFSFVFEEMMLLAIALFGGISCFVELQRLKFEATGDDAVFAESMAMTDDERPTYAERAAAKKAEKARAEAQATQTEIDRILAKISGSGMDSLTKKEKKTLEQASERGRSL